MLTPATHSTRRPYTRADYRHVLHNYTRSGVSAREVARQLGRTTGSLQFYISSNPELRKRSHEKGPSV